MTAAATLPDAQDDKPVSRFRSRNWFGIRSRMAALALAIAVPFLALLTLSSVIDRSNTLSGSVDRVLTLARGAADREGDVLTEARVIVNVMATMPSSMAVDGDCGSRLSGIVRDRHAIGALSFARQDGSVACTSVANGAKGTFSDRQWFKDALIADGVVVSGMIVSRVTGDRVVVVASRSADGKLVAAAGVKMSYLSTMASSLSGETRTMTIFDASDGTILARYPDATAWVGKKLSALPGDLLAVSRNYPGDVAIEGHDLDGRPTVFGVTTVPDGSVDMRLAVGEARADVLSAANHRMIVGAFAAILATLAAAMVAWSLGRRTILNPLSSLTYAVSGFGAGDMTVRAFVATNGVPELAALARSFNAMASGLQRGRLERERTRSQLARSEELHRILAENSSDLIVRLNSERRYEYVSPSCVSLLGYEPAELMAMNPVDLVHPAHRAAFGHILEAIAAGAPELAGQYRMRRKDGSGVWVETLARRIGDGSGCVAVVRDVTVRKKLETRLEGDKRRLETLAMSDGLTGLANRRRFDECLDREFAQAVRDGAPFCVAMIDIDSFKAFNDTYGHPQGDVTLKAVANAVKLCARRPTDITARYGGEEMAILFPGTDLEGASTAADRLVQDVRDLAIPHSGSPFGCVTISVGVARLDIQADASVLLADADRALYAAKMGGKNSVMSWNSDSQSAA